MKKFLIIAVALIAGIFIFLTVYKKQPVVTVTTEQVEDMPALETPALQDTASVDVTASAETTAPVETPAN